MVGLTQLGHVWSCLVMFGHVWSCLVMFGHVWFIGLCQRDSKEGQKIAISAKKTYQ